MFQRLLSCIRSFFIKSSPTVEDNRERAIEAILLLNDFGGDLICATRSFEYFDTFLFKADKSEQMLRLFNKMADTFLFVTLAKWIEFYDRYHLLITAEEKPICKKLRDELDRRGVREFRNKVVGHIWSRKHNRPLLPSETEELDKKITKGDPRSFLKWINDPRENRIGVTIVGTTEAVRDAIKEKWALSEPNLSVN